SIEGGGSGVVLTRDGLILTNFHVVNTPLPISVTATVKSTAGGVEEKTFEKVKVTKVHPEYDLALIKIEDRRVAFAPARILPKDRPIETGAQCFAIGNPDGGEAGVLDLTITAGLVSSASRTLDNLEYLQVDAAVNPGNSGGAIVNARGEVAGIVTFKLEGREGIAFAIPTKNLSMEDFVEPKEKSGDLEKALVYQAEGNRAMNAAQLSGSLEEREYLNYLGLLYHRLALMQAPNAVAMRHNLGLSYARLGEVEIGRQYFLSALELEPHFSPSCYSLAMIEIKEQKSADALKFLEAGAQDRNPNNLDMVSACLDHWARIEAESGNFSRAAYLVKWANSLHPAQGQNALPRRQVESLSVSRLTEAQKQFIEGKTEEFSFAELKKFSEEEEGMVAENAPKGSTLSLTGDGIVSMVIQHSSGVERQIIHTIETSFPSPPVLEDAPDGATLAGTTLSWKVEAGFSEPFVEVLLSYREGEETKYVIEKIPVN
ncbi:MAG: trypsin-like peptidase domain-containing protein, partial [Verrucomicrobiota bacterium]